MNSRSAGLFVATMFSLIGCTKGTIIEPLGDHAAIGDSASGGDAQLGDSSQTGDVATGGDVPPGDPVAGGDPQPGDPVQGGDPQPGDPVQGGDPQPGDPAQGGDGQPGDPNGPCTGVDCSGHGWCDNGTCVCNTGYAGADCSACASGYVPSGSSCVLDSDSCTGQRYTPTHYVTSTAAGGGDGSQVSPWTMVEAFANAVPGNRVVFAPGMYLAPLTNTNRLPTFFPANAGAPGNRIVFFAEQPAVCLTDTGQMSRIHLDDGTGPVIGANDYVTFDGFDLKQRDDHVFTSEGSVVGLWSVTGVEITRCLFDGESVGLASSNWGAIFIEGGRDIEIADNRFVRFDSGADENLSTIMLYDSEYYEIHHNQFTDCYSPFFPKGVHTGEPDLLPGSFHHNRLERVGAPWNVGGVGQDTPGPGEYLDIYQNVIWGGDAVVLRAYNDTSPSGLRVVNNTFVMEGTSEGVIYGAGAPATGNGIYANSISANNIYVLSSGERYYLTYATTSLAELSRWQHDGNLYDGINEFFNGGTSFAEWQAAGFDENGAVGDPTFEGAGTGDFRLGTGSPALGLGTDVLDLLGGGTAASINAGAYILPDQSDQIGVR